MQMEAKNADLKPQFWICINWRRGRDSNPRSPARGTTVFETAPFDRSGTSPSERRRGVSTSRARTSSERKDRSVRGHGPRRQPQADGEVAVRRAPGDKTIVALLRG